jgi:hypothetical protein
MGKRWYEPIAQTASRVYDKVSSLWRPKKNPWVENMEEQLRLVHTLSDSGDVQSARAIAANTARELGDAYRGLGRPEKANRQYKLAARAYEEGGMVFAAFEMYKKAGDETNASRLRPTVEALVKEHHPLSPRRAVALFFSSCFFVMSILFSVFSLTGYATASMQLSSFSSWGVVFFVLGIVFALFFLRKKIN